MKVADPADKQIHIKVLNLLYKPTQISVNSPHYELLLSRAQEMMDVPQAGPPS